MSASRVSAVALLCVLSGSGWLLTQFYPGELGYPFSSCIHFLLIGIVAITVWLRAGGPALAAKPSVTVMFTGIAIFALPATVRQVAVGAVSEFFSVAVLCAIPIFTVLLLGVWTSGGLNTRGLIAGVAGLGGALRLFPVALPASARGWAFATLLILSCVAIASASNGLHRLLQRAPLATVVAIVSLASAATLAVYGASVGWPALTPHAVGIECLRCLVFDLPVVWLTVWLIREIAPQRLSARFLIVPLITAAESYAAMRGGVDLSAAIAMVIMAAGGLMLLLGNESEEVPSLHLR